MMKLVLWAFIFAVSLFVLIKASGYFTGAAEKIGPSFRMSSFITGVVIVGVGTSLPELISSIIAVTKGASEIVIGNVLGSNITNIFLVMGIVAVLKKSYSFNYDIVKADLPILLGSSFLISLMMWDMTFSRTDALLCLACLGIYFIHSCKSPQDNNGKQEQKDEKKTVSIRT